MTDSTVSRSATRAAQELRVLTGRLRRRFLEATDNQGVTPSQASLLSRLKAGDASASELAAAERVRPQAVASQLAALDETGLIERHPDPNDRRRQVVSLSREGREFLDGRRQAGHEWLAATLEEQYTEAERQELLHALTLLERLVRE
ncbi:MarR family winged helix-turn-helix transcriptional regulator [Nocardia terpenica]|uniref:MarR family transcriptional regulator n=1 Tax=Nocardia terpenica TaxID=455432 RepID=A0A6G9Z5Q8_9NOCA|nr:MarR family transcriptional regulator [Nocardia terpenica]QIS20804.1 MarR family transcriptional regulator [Nocardia terpenica]